jgi:NAD(P)-dependent dehydrogenase (short-subunit alcohol dehydrogenase family)
VVLVTGAEAPLGLGLALAMANAGAAVGVLGHVDHEVVGALGATGARMVVAPTDLGGADEIDEAMGFAAERLGPVDAVVHAAVDPVAFERRALAQVDDAHFAAVWEGTMEATLWVLQAAYRAFAGRGGRIVVTVPTLAMSGAPGLVPYAAAAEGQRLLVKSAARQWGSDGITVNCIAVAPELAMAGGPPRAFGPEDASLAAAALGGIGDPELDVAPVCVFLVGEGGAFVTGTTITLDGGVWMAP